MNLIYLLSVFPSTPRTGLDPSWSNTINYAFINNMSFGKQIIFTFGPLGSFRFPGYVYSEQTYNVAIFLFNKNKELA